MAALEVNSGFTTAAGLIGAAYVVCTLSGGTFTVRNFSKGNAWLLSMWAHKQVATGGKSRVRSPRFHDNTNGVAMVAAQTQRVPIINSMFPQRLYAQDTLVVESNGSATAGDIEQTAFLTYYEFLDGANGVFIDLKELDARIVNIFTLNHLLVGATSGVYGSTQAINAGTLGDTFKANTQYALIGATFAESTVSNATVVRITGPDTGNLGIGIPVMPEAQEICQKWFIHLTQVTGRPLIPVINSANKGGTVLDVLNSENANSVTTSTQWAELR